MDGWYAWKVFHTSTQFIHVQMNTYISIRDIGDNTQYVYICILHIQYVVHMPLYLYTNNNQFTY